MLRCTHWNSVLGNRRSIDINTQCHVLAKNRSVADWVSRLLCLCLFSPSPSPAIGLVCPSTPCTRSTSCCWPLHFCMPYRSPYVMGTIIMHSACKQQLTRIFISYEVNPILQHQPEFARSLPVQILLNGIVLTLTTVLLIHLLFTTQYHWTLAPVNYSLQLAGVLSLLTSLIATLSVVLTGSFEDTQVWPYMIKYIAKDVPPSSSYSNITADEPFESTQWTTAELAAWYAMDATTSALVQVCLELFYDGLR